MLYVLGDDEDILGATSLVVLFMGPTMYIATMCDMQSIMFAVMDVNTRPMTLYHL
jgi:hypothetical protein